MLHEKYWTKRYHNQETGWDIGYVSTPLKEYVDQLVNKSTKILIPGAGNAYEAEYLFNQGFDNVYVLDISEAPLKAFSERCPNFPKEQLILSDFFNFKTTFDLILEQTFFCALDPEFRSLYSKKMHSLLNDGGKLVGVLFNFPLTEKGPPFGGSVREYKKRFERYFDIQIMEKAYNSIKPRDGAELFIKLNKR